MKSSLLLVTTFLIVDFTMAIGSDWDVLHVDGVNGTHDEFLCQLGLLPCATLNLAIGKFSSYRKTKTLIQVSPGNYTLNNTKANHIESKYGVAIIGSGENNTVVNCEPSAGIYFEDCANVTIEFITFVNCGYGDLTQTSVWLATKGHSSRFPLQPAAIVVTNTWINIVTIHNVTIQNSSGSGLFFYSVSGNISISNTSVTDGTGTNSSQIGGGIVIVGGYSATQYSISQVVISNNDYSLTPTIFDNEFFGAGLLVIRTPHSMYIDSSVISSNTRGLYVHNDAVYLRNYFNCTNIEVFNITINNTAILSNKEDSLVEILDFYYIDLTLFDTSISNKIIAKYSAVRSKCYLQIQSSLEINVICTKPQSSCQIPQIDNQVHYQYYTDSRPGTCTNDPTLNFRGKCPVPYSTGTDDETSYYLPNCWDNHDGVLCGQCKEGHSVAINSPYLSCVPCDGRHNILKGWGLLIALEFIPITVMISVIALLNVNLNQGSLKAYIFYCQILTIPFPSVSYPSWFVLGYNYDMRIMDFSPFPFMTMWNLGFISYPSCNLFSGNNQCLPKWSICISQHTTALEAISFWYLIAFLYPFLLLILFYFLVTAYYKGYRCVTCFVTPIHRLLGRFWQIFDIHPSLPVTIASVYTLCFTQLAATSLKLLHGATFMNKNVFFYDGSQPYFQGAHGAAATLALIVLIVFIIAPVVYLSMHPFRCFQLCLNRVKIRKDLLISITDVFTAPYSNGTQNTWDYRYLASSHFILQLSLMILYYIPLDYHYVILISQIVICFLFMIYLAVFRPYKRKIHTFTEIIIMFTLMGYSGCFIAVSVDSLHYDSFIFLVLIIPLMFSHPFIALCYCCFVWFPRKCKRCYSNYHQQFNTVQELPLVVLHVDDQDNIQDERENDDLVPLPDRMVNPVHYRSLEK